MLHEEMRSEPGNVEARCIVSRAKVTPRQTCHFVVRHTHFSIRCLAQGSHTSANKSRATRTPTITLRSLRRILALAKSPHQAKKRFLKTWRVLFYTKFDTQQDGNLEMRENHIFKVRRIFALTAPQENSPYYFYFPHLLIELPIFVLSPNFWLSPPPLLSLLFTAFALSGDVLPSLLYQSALLSSLALIVRCSALYLTIFALTTFFLSVSSANTLWFFNNSRFTTTSPKKTFC